MIRRLAAAALFCLTLTACEGRSAPEPVPKAPAVKASGAGQPAYTPAVSPTLQAVRTRGQVICGVHAGLPGFAFPDVRGQWRGFDVDVCRALAAATLGDASMVRFVPIAAQDRFSALQAGRIDVLSRNTSLTYARDAGLGLSFPAVTYYDARGSWRPGPWAWAAPRSCLARACASRRAPPARATLPTGSAPGACATGR